MSRFERRLRDAWSLGLPSVPAHLQSYCQAWQNCLQQPMEEATDAEMSRAMRRSTLLLVSDFHPLPRSRTGLASLLQRLPPDQALVLGLELLPYGTTVTALEAKRGAGRSLITGQSLGEAYAAVLDILAPRKATIVGTWVEGSVQRRDALAAELWQRMQSSRKNLRAVFHFGDWHLADTHLPAQMESRGAHPVVIHQSPEPIWERVGLSNPGRVFRLPKNHWAWLQTPTLGLWANHLQNLGDHDPEMAVEAAEHLCESASEHLASTLGLPMPVCRLTVATPKAWPEFHRRLPRRLAAALDSKQPPLIPVFHPRLPLLWSPNTLDLAHLIQGAAHCLNCSSPYQSVVGLLPELRRTVLRFLCSHLVNPFLCNTSLTALSAQLLPPAYRAEAVQQVERLCTTPARWHEFSPAAEALFLGHAGGLIGATLAHQDKLHYGDMRKFLEPAEEGFDWEALMATIRVA